MPNIENGQILVFPKPERRLHSVSPQTGKTGKVIGFIDRDTLEIRREAVERVRRDGIFTLPDPRPHD